MLKQTINYEDFDGNPSVDTLYFNLSKTELTENLELSKQFEYLNELFQGEERQLSVDEVQKVLNLVKEVMRLSYGVKSPDGKRFQKGGDIWAEFTETAAYDAFLYSLFEDPNKANNFLLGVFPKDLVEEAKMQIEAGIAPQVIENAQTRTLPSEPEEEESKIPAYIRENREPTRDELLNMSREEMLEAMKRKMHTEE